MSLRCNLKVKKKGNLRKITFFKPVSQGNKLVSWPDKLCWITLQAGLLNKQGRCSARQAVWGYGTCLPRGLASVKNMAPAENPAFQEGVAGQQAIAATWLFKKCEGSPRKDAKAQSGAPGNARGWARWDRRFSHQLSTINFQPSTLPPIPRFLTMAAVEWALPREW